MNAYSVGPGIVLVGVLCALLVFGFFPVVVSKAISFAFRRDDPRRREVVAEVYAVPRWERPIWIGEQLGRVFTEAIPSRVAARRRGVVFHVTRSQGGKFDVSALLGVDANVEVSPAGIGQLFGRLTVGGHVELFAIDLRDDVSEVEIHSFKLSRRRRTVRMGVGLGMAEFTIPLRNLKRSSQSTVRA